MGPEGIDSDSRLAALSTIVGRLGTEWDQLDSARRLEELDRIQRYVGAMRRSATNEEGVSKRNADLGLTLRERQVLALLVDGASTTQVARRLGISDGTVRSHVKNILSKLGVHSRLEAVALVRRSQSLFEQTEDDETVAIAAFS